MRAAFGMGVFMWKTSFPISAKEKAHLQF
jgi:hypothetical protein